MDGGGGERACVVAVVGKCATIIGSWPRSGWLPVGAGGWVCGEVLSKCDRELNCCGFGVVADDGLFF